MKKTLALILALTMTATVAFAAGTVKPGDKIEVPMLGLPGAVAGVAGIAEWDTTNPAIAPTKELNKDNYTITSSNWTKGKDMVSSVAFSADEDLLVIKLRNDYKSYKEKDLVGTVKIRDKKNATVHTLNVETKVTYTLGTIDIDADHYATLSGDTQDTVYKVFDAGSTYGTLEFDVSSLASVVGKVYKDEIFFFGINETPAKDILVANADNTGNVDVINFVGAPTFVSAATVRLYTDQNTYIYEYKDGRLTRLNATWRSDEDAYEIKTRTLGYYVLSEEPLKSATTTTTPGTTTPNVTNPNTGANDAMGVASALAALTLVSAAALSLKKKA